MNANIYAVTATKIRMGTSRVVGPAAPIRRPALAPRDVGFSRCADMRSIAVSRSSGIDNAG